MEGTYTPQGGILEVNPKSVKYWDPKEENWGPKREEKKNYSTSPILSSAPKEWLRGTLRPPSLWTAARHHQGATVEDPEASQLVDNTSASGGGSALQARSSGAFGHRGPVEQP